MEGTKDPSIGLSAFDTGPTLAYVALMTVVI